MSHCHLIFCILLLVVSCAPVKVTQPEHLRPSDTVKAARIEPQARALFFQAEKAFNAKNFDLAAKLYQSVKAKFPKGEAHKMSSYRLGMVYYYREDFVAATNEFEYFLNHFPDSNLTFDVTYNLAACEYQQRHYEKTYSILSRFKLSDVQAQGPRRAETVIQLTARTAAALGNHPGAVAAYATQMQLPLDEGKRISLQQQVAFHLSKITTRADLERLFSELTEPTTRAKITERLGQIALLEKPPPEKAPSTPAISETSKIHLPGGSSGEKTHIGVLLPLTGRFAAYGRRALDGILLAAKNFEGLVFQLFIEDTNSNPLIAQSAVEELFQKNKVCAIIGPLNWKEAIAAGEKAQQLGVLNLTLSAKEGISEKGPYLFQNALTPKVQLQNLVEFCITDKQFKRFAILAPNNNFGNDMTNQFWDFVERNGGRIVAYQVYPDDEKDFQSYIRELVGTASQKFRKIETTKLQQFLLDQKSKGMKEPKAQLAPIIDFDALFIPDSPKTVAQIAASLAYFDVSGIPLLGTAEWNTDQLYKRGGKYVEGAIFPGAIHSGTSNPRQKDFIRAYLESYGMVPDLLAAQAYEAMRLVGVAATKSSSNDRNELVNQLASLRNFDTPLGSISFDSFRVAQRKLPIYTLSIGGTIVEQ